MNGAYTATVRQLQICRSRDAAPPPMSEPLYLPLFILA